MFFRTIAEGDKDEQVLLYESLKDAYMELLEPNLVYNYMPISGHVLQLTFYAAVETTNNDAITLLEQLNNLIGGGQVLAFKPQGGASRLLGLIHFMQNDMMSVEEYFNEGFPNPNS